MSNSDEKRGFLRVPIDWEAQIDHPDNKITIKIINLSLGGFMFSCEEPLHVDQQLLINLPLGSFTAKIQWCSDNTCGASFTELSGGETGALAKEIYDRWSRVIADNY